ncbi:MAG: MBL fold metallo-hydrolase [Candidatus Poriferisodalaceae bacterium]
MSLASFPKTRFPNVSKRPTSTRAGVNNIIFSHLHFDHCGGTSLIPNARIIVQNAEWDSAHHPKLIEHEVYNPADFDLGHDVLKIDGTHDVFGDGSVMCIPTPGHTAGHQSLRVNSRERTGRVNGRLRLLGGGP